MPQKIIVIGAGIIGAAIARNLAMRGAAVTVLEQAASGGASRGSFGWINANFADSAAYFALRRAAMDEWRDTEFQLQCAGGLWWELQGDAFERHHRALTDYGYAAQKITAERFAELEPNIADAPSQCIYSSLERAVDAAACTETFLRDAQRHGAIIKTDCFVTGIKVKREKVCGVFIADKTLTADTVVVAAGAQTQNLLATIAIPLPMQNRAGIIIKTEPVAPVVRHVIFTPQIHFWQQNDGALIAGETFTDDDTFTNDNGGNPKPNQPDALATEILRRIKAMLPKTRNLKLAQTTRQTRPIPADGLPAIGTPANLTGIYIATTHSGITLAPLIGKLATKEILQNDNANLLKPFRLSRFVNEITT